MRQRPDGDVKRIRMLRSGSLKSESSNRDTISLLMQKTSLKRVTMKQDAAVNVMSEREREKGRECDRETEWQVC